MKPLSELIGKTPRELKEEAEADETPEKAFMDIPEDERFVKQLYEKFKALAPK